MDNVCDVKEHRAFLSVDVPVVNHGHVTPGMIKCFEPAGVLFTGVGKETNVISLIEYCPVLCNDFEITNPSLNWVLGDCRKLDYSSITNKYDTIIPLKLCNGDAGIVFRTLNDGLWKGFTNIIINFCNTPKHYGSLDSYINSVRSCEELLKNRDGFNTQLVKNYGKYLNFNLFASRNELPSLDDLFPEPAPKSNYSYQSNNGFWDGGLPDWYKDGAYYD
ncbi:MAG: hypothetical protein WC307_02970 [Candidatus Nanoarchaeia archaeon]|jgi:hypothetical protein